MNCKFFKSAVFIALAFFIAQSGLFSQTGPSGDYSCKEIINGVETGQTIVLTVNYLPGDVVEVTRTYRPSVPEDVVAFYDLTYSPYTENGNEITFQFGEGAWYVPFDGGAASRIAQPYTVGVWCKCIGGNGDCDVELIEHETEIGKFWEIDCKVITCNGKCKPCFENGLNGSGITFYASELNYND